MRLATQSDQPQEAIAPGEDAAVDQPDFFPREPLWTPEIDRKVAIVVEWVKCDLPGGHIWGIQRIGKSEFAKYLVHIIPQLLGNCAIGLLWDFLGCKPKNPEDLLRKCLVGTGCNAIASRNPVVLQQRLVMLLVARCRAARAKRVVLIIDEMQNVPPAQYDVFMSICADLLKEGLIPHLLSIGQPEMCQTIELIFQSDALQTIGRIFPTTEIYYGLSLADVGELLQNIDGDDRAFTSSRFPERAADGWGIADLTVPIRQAVEEMLVRKNLTAIPRIPVGYLRPTLNRMFRYLAADPGAVVDCEVALACFKFSGLPRVIGHYVEQS